MNHELHPQACRLAEVRDIHCAHFKKGQLPGLAPEDVGRRMRFSVDVIVACYTLTGATPAELEAESALWRLRPFGAPTLEEIPTDTVTPSELLAGLKLAYEWTDCPAEDDGISPRASQSDLDEFNEGKAVREQLKALIARAEAVIT